ncbi:sugar transport protein 7-like [Capsella rubella]|uniref:sugar transport protein 7-like n=1 Tax=Capsella rubella TaxID=81985 RepID=UPI000CD4E9D3|nr:sugar transport protein 7-like [Capsella rubella]
MLVYLFSLFCVSHMHTCEFEQILLHKIRKMVGRSLRPAEVVNERAEQYQGKVTGSVVVTCFVAAIGGCIFGYDIGVSGAVTSMDEFLIEFFHDVYEKKRHAHENNYCKFDNQGLAAFNSLLNIAGLLASLMASPISRNYGRLATIICAGISEPSNAVSRTDHDRFWRWI